MKHKLNRMNKFTTTLSLFTSLVALYLLYDIAVNPPIIKSDIQVEVILTKDNGKIEDYGRVDYLSFNGGRG